MNVIWLNQNFPNFLMYDPTAKKVKAREGDFIGAATSLGAGMVSNVLHAPGAIVDTVTGK